MGRESRRAKVSGVLVGISAAETARFTDFWDSVLHMGAPIGCPIDVRIERGGNIAKNRNGLTKAFLSSPREWLLYLDDDQILMPGTIQQLLAHGKEIVSGCYVSRDYPFPPMLFDREADDGRVGMRLCGPEDRGLVSVTAIGAGCLLVHRTVFAQLEPPYWTLGQIIPDGMSDDIDFCRRVRRAGFDIWCDLDTRVGHKSHCTLWPERTARGIGCTVVTGNRPVCHIPPPVTEAHGVSVG